MHANLKETGPPEHLDSRLVTGKGNSKLPFLIQRFQDKTSFNHEFESGWNETEHTLGIALEFHVYYFIEQIWQDLLVSLYAKAIVQTKHS